MSNEASKPRKFAVMSRIEHDSNNPDADPVELFFVSDGRNQVGDDTRVYAEAAAYARALNNLTRQEQNEATGRLAPMTPVRYGEQVDAALLALTLNDQQGLAAALQPMVETQQRAIRSLISTAESVARIGWERPPWANLDRSGHGDAPRAAAGHLVELHIRHGWRAGWDQPIPPGTVTYATGVLSRDDTGEFVVAVLVNLLVMLGDVRAQRLSPRQ